MTPALSNATSDPLNNDVLRHIVERESANLEQAQLEKRRNLRASLATLDAEHARRRTERAGQRAIAERELSAARSAFEGADKRLRTATDEVNRLTWAGATEDISHETCRRATELILRGCADPRLAKAIDRAHAATDEARLRVIVAERHTFTLLGPGRERTTNAATVTAFVAAARSCVQRLQAAQLGLLSRADVDQLLGDVERELRAAGASLDVRIALVDS